MSLWARQVALVAQEASVKSSLANRGYDMGVIRFVNDDGTYRVMVLARTDADGDDVSFNNIGCISGAFRFSVGDTVILSRTQGQGNRLTIVGKSPWQAAVASTQIIEV